MSNERGNQSRPNAVALQSPGFQPEMEIQQSQQDRSLDLLRDSTFLGVISAVAGPEQLLLSYFLDGMTKVISCHSGIQKELCSALLPMALATPPSSGRNSSSGRSSSSISRSTNQL